MMKRKRKRKKHLPGKDLVLAHKIFTGAPQHVVEQKCCNCSMSWKSESESFLTWTYKYTRNRKRHSVYQLGEFSSVKKNKTGFPGTWSLASNQETCPSGCQKKKKKKKLVTWEVASQQGNSQVWGWFREGIKLVRYY